jgi:hypothetical protein
MTAYQLASYNGKIDILVKECEWAQEKFTKEEIFNKVLLATDNEVMSVFHRASYNVKVNI